MRTKRLPDGVEHLDSTVDHAIHVRPPQTNRATRCKRGPFFAGTME
jgi:hypothetical protein